MLWNWKHIVLLPATVKMETVSSIWNTGLSCLGGFLIFDPLENQNFKKIAMRVNVFWVHKLFSKFSVVNAFTEEN